MGLGLLEDVEKNAERLDILAAAARLRVPYLILHGAADESVSVTDAERLAASAPPESTRFLAVDGAGHTFGAVHPFQGATRHLARVVELTAGWFEENLGGDSRDRGGRKLS